MTEYNASDLLEYLTRELGEDDYLNWVEVEYVIPKENSGKSIEIYQSGSVWGSGKYVSVPEFKGGKVRIADDRYSGGEGSQEDIYLVLSVTDEEGDVRYFRKEGYYASYNGSNWDGAFAEVFPREVSVTQWTTLRP